MKSGVSNQPTLCSERKNKNRALRKGWGTLFIERIRDSRKGGPPVPPSSDATSPWRVRRFGYDSFSRLLTAQNPETGTISYTYDNDGNLIQKTSPTQQISYCYDKLHRLTDKSYTPQPPVIGQPCTLTGVVVHNTYDVGTYGIGHLTSLTDPAGTGSYGYDALGRMITETRGIYGSGNTLFSKSMTYEYNLDSSLKTLHYPSGAAVGYGYTNAGRIGSALDSGHSINYATGTTGYATHSPDGQLTSFISGYSSGFAGIINSFSYNSRLQPITMSAASPSQTVFSLTYDFHSGAGNNGNVWAITNNRDTTRSQTFAYDSLNRLISAQTTGTDCSVSALFGKTKYWANTYVYDAWGNLTDKNKTGCGAEDLHFKPDTQNRIHVPAGADYVYDAAGNMTTNAHEAQNYTYDAENRIIAGGGLTYAYDADGNRVAKSNGATGTLYWYMSPGIVGESDLNGSLTAEYAFFAGERIARRDNPGSPNAMVSYYFSDHLKTASVITDSAGNIKSDSDYYPWGGELQFVANDSNHYKFTGKERDTETNLDYFGARYYANALGRFITPDWSASKDPDPVPYADLPNPQSLNLYAYTKNNPTTLTDPNGHCTKDGKQHGAVWCFFHYSDQDLQRDADRARKNLAGVKNITVNGQKPQDFIKNATNEQVLEAQRKIVEFLLAQVGEHPCGYSGVSCGIVFPVGRVGAEFAEDYATSATVNESATYASEGEARAVARTKLGKDAVEVAPGKWRSADGKWQYRAKPDDVSENHIHLERLNPQTGEVIYNLHLRWPEGTER